MIPFPNVQPEFQGPIPKSGLAKTPALQIHLNEGSEMATSIRPATKKDC